MTDFSLTVKGGVIRIFFVSTFLDWYNWYNYFEKSLEKVASFGKKSLEKVVGYLCAD